MKTIEQIGLTPLQKKALGEIKEQLEKSFRIESITLYGSVSRGEADLESDIDLLIITEEFLNRETRHQITDIVFEINLKYNTNFSTLVLDKKNWEGVYSVLPLKTEILRDGVIL